MQLHQHSFCNRSYCIISRSKNTAWHYNAGIQSSFPHRVQHTLAGNCLGLSIYADNLCLIKTFRFRHFLPMRQFRNRSGTSHINEFLTFRMLQTAVNNIHGSLDIDIHNQLPAFFPQCHHACTVHNDRFCLRWNLKKFFQ